MPHYARICDARVLCLQTAGQVYQTRILFRRKRIVIMPLQLNTQREIIAVFTPAKPTLTGMPGSRIAGDKLQQLAITTNQEMRRNLYVFQLLKIGMLLRVEAVAEKLLDFRAAIHARRQANAMYHQQIHRVPGGSLIEIWRGTMTRYVNPTIVQEHRITRLCLLVTDAT